MLQGAVVEGQEEKSLVKEPVFEGRPSSGGGRPGSGGPGRPGLRDRVDNKMRSTKRTDATENSTATFCSGGTMVATEGHTTAGPDGFNPNRTAGNGFGGSSAHNTAQVGGSSSSSSSAHNTRYADTTGQGFFDANGVTGLSFSLTIFN